jgi:hypothetical protein
MDTVGDASCDTIAIHIVWFVDYIVRRQRGGELLHSLPWIRYRHGQRWSRLAKNDFIEHRISPR